MVTKARASVSVLVPGATASYVIPTASLAWVSIVFLVDIDPIGRHPILKDIGLTVDQAHKSFAKSIHDSFAEVDVEAIILVKKAPAEFVSLSESSNTLIEKLVLNSITATDDFYGEANSDDDETLWFSKSSSDNISIYSNETISSVKVLSEVTSFEDVQNIFDVRKGRSDLSHAIDTTSNSFIPEIKSEFVRNLDEVHSLVSKVFLEIKYFTDLITSKVFGKPLSDSVTATDDFYGVANSDDDETIFLSKHVQTELQYSIDIDSLEFNKNNIESKIVSEQNTISLGKVFTESSFNLDGPYIDVDYCDKSYLLEDYVATGIPILDFGKFLSDNTESTESYSSYLSKLLGEFTANYDAMSFMTEKSVSDNLIKSDSNNILFGKSQTDSLETSESNSLVTYKLLEDTVYPTDDFYGVANTDDDETISLNKYISINTSYASEEKGFLLNKATINEAVTKSDVVSVVSIKSINETISIPIDSSSVFVDKSATDAATSSEIKLIGLSRHISESVSKVDSSSHVLLKSISESAVSSESYGRSIFKNLSDGFITSESFHDVIYQTSVYCPPLTDLFTKSDSSAHIVSKQLLDSVSKGDSASRNLSKSILDSAISSELIARVLSRSAANDSSHPTDSARNSHGKFLTETSHLSDSGDIFIQGYSDPTYFNDRYVGVDSAF